MNIANFLARSAAHAVNAVAIYQDDAVYASYGQLLSTSLQLAACLQSRAAGVAASKVAIIADNCPEYIESLFAIWAAGFTAVPINARLHPKEVGYILADSQASLCLCDESHTASIPESLSDVESSEQPLFVLTFAELKNINAAALDKAVVREASDIAWLFYTSGTTGNPKGVMLTHENLRQMALNFLSDVENTKRNFRLLHYAPLSHGSGMYLLPYVVAGAANIIPHHYRFKEDECVALMNRHENISMFMAPTMVRRLVEMKDAGELDISRLQTIIFGGAPMLVTDLKQACALLGQHVAQIYGQGESPMTISCLSRSEISTAIQNNDMQVLESAGRPFTGVDVATINNACEFEGENQIGEIAVKGQVVMKGYWRNASATNEQFQDGWLKTGDLGILDRRGYLTLKDRSRDVIISGGMNIYPRELEQVLAQHGAVSETAVVAHADQDWGECPIAFVVLKQQRSVSTAELDRFCLKHIARFKRPKGYRFVSHLPKNNYGKILKRELKMLLDADTDFRPANLTVFNHSTPTISGS